MQICRRMWLRCAAKLDTTLIHPIRRALHPPEYTARGVAVGLFVSFTPTFGAHIPFVFALWGAAKIVNGNLAFNPVIALAWTLFVNIFTVAPLYYLFVQTGRFMLGHWEHIQSYASYLPQFENVPHAHTSWIEGLWSQAVGLVGAFGVPLFIGSLPWAVAIGLIGYFWSLRFVRRHRAAVAHRPHRGR